MLKKLIVVCCLTALFSSQAIALNVNVKTEIFQGQTLKLSLRDLNYQEISGTFNDRGIKFSKETRLLAFDEPISRVDFLELLFANFEASAGLKTLENDFEDVDAAHKTLIKKAYEAGIIDGFPDGLFRPDATITRGQAAKILVNAFKLENSIKINFVDLPVYNSFYSYIAKAAAAGIFVGYPDGLFRPDRPINFSEAEIVVKRATKKESIHALGPQEFFVGYAAAHRIDDLGLKTLTINAVSDNGEKLDLSENINVLKQNFKKISFNLAQDKTNLFGKDYQTPTWNAIYSAIAETTEKQLWEGQFIIPTKGEITLGYGDLLYINGKYSGSHFGIDYANPLDTPVYASNNGIITLAEETPAYGKVVIIDHGMNVFSMYLHLDEILVSKGQSVKKSDLIAKSGSTGLSTGNHLHFTIFVGNVIVDNKEWLNGSFL